MKTRAVFMDWPVAQEEPERVLNDLARWTGLNTLLLFTCFAMKWTGARSGVPLILPSLKGFEGLGAENTQEGFDLMNSFAELAKSYGFKIVCHLCPNLGLSLDLAGLGCTTVKDARPDSESDDGLIWSCPNNPQTIQYGTAFARGAVESWTVADMLGINHVEYAFRPRSSLSELFVCFCKHCRDKAEEQGIAFGRMKFEVAAFHDAVLSGRRGKAGASHGTQANGVLNFLIEHPSVAEWLNFRMSSMSDFIKTIVAAARESAAKSNPDLKIGMEFFLPSASNLVGTDFNNLYELFDWVSPKFPDYVPGGIVPEVADELASAGGLATVDDLRAAGRELLDLGVGPAKYEALEPPSDALRYSNTFDRTIIDRQMKHLSRLMGKIDMYPWIWLHNRDLESLRQKVNAVEENGFNGYYLWIWQRDFSTANIRQLEGII